MMTNRGFQIVTAHGHDDVYSRSFLSSGIVMLCDRDVLINEITYTYPLLPADPFILRNVFAYY